MDFMDTANSFSDWVILFFEQNFKLIDKFKINKLVTR